MRWTIAVSLTVLMGLPAAAEEGMWPFNMAPVDAVKADYGFEITPAWLEKAQKASVRFNSGASGSFVSGEGLVLTNHHVGADCIQKLSQGEKDVMADGLVTTDRSQELACPDLELNQLLAIEDVTEKVEAATKDAKDDAARNKARKARMAELEKACAEKTGRRCDVVTLYAGGAYHLYQYKKFTDVRLVFAPEFEAAFFGGDPDNFTYPRTCLDVAFFRAYEDGKPAKTPDFLRVSKKGAVDGELVFVSGNPGSTGRLDTPARLKFLATVAYPFTLKSMEKLEARLAKFMARGEVEHKAGRDDFFGTQNGIKAFTGYLGGLKDPALIAEVEKRHAAAQAALKTLPEAERARLLEAWPELEKAYRTYAEIYRPYSVTERWSAPRGQLVNIARHLLRLGEELPKPNGERLREYRDSALESLELRLFSEAPIHDGHQVEMIAGGLENMLEVLGADDPTVKAALQGKTPEERAAEVVAGTRLKDVAFRKELRKGGAAAVKAAKDPLVEFVRAYDTKARALRQRYEDEVESVERRYAGRIAEAWAKAFGRSVYPDATFTLRLNHGTVKGYTLDGRKVPWRTTIADLFAKWAANKGKKDYALPKSWTEARPKLDPTTPYNFVSTNDIIGGNSGSPVFNKDLKVVGLIFDGNIQQLPNRFLYRDEHGRSVSVHMAGILHALEKVYDAKALLAELGG